MFKLIIIFTLVVLLENFVVRVVDLASTIVGDLVFGHELTLTPEDYKKTFHVNKYIEGDYVLDFYKDRRTYILYVGNSRVDLESLLNKEVYIQGKYPVLQNKQCIKDKCHYFGQATSSSSAIQTQTIHIYEASERKYTLKDYLLPFNLGEI